MKTKIETKKTFKEFLNEFKKNNPYLKKKAQVKKAREEYRKYLKELKKKMFKERKLEKKLEKELKEKLDLGD